MSEIVFLFGLDEEANALDLGPDCMSNFKLHLCAPTKEWIKSHSSPLSRHSVS
jgi:hypothetical protein